MSTKRTLLCVLLLLVVLIVSTSVSADCPKSITTPTVLDQDLHCPTGGPRLEAADLTLDCQGHSIIGAGTGTGVTMVADNVAIKSCTLTGFETGVRATGLSQATISDSLITRNTDGLRIEQVKDARIARNTITHNKKAGIHTTESRILTLMNSFEGNGQDLLEEDRMEGAITQETKEHRRVDLLTGKAPLSLPPATTPDPEESARVPPLTIFENTVTEDAIALLPLEPEARSEAALAVTIKRHYRIEGDRTVFFTALTAGRDAQNLAVYEIIPKIIIASAFDAASTHPHTIVKYDPILRFPVGALAKGKEVRFEYSVPGRITPGTTDLPISVAVTETPKAFQPPFWIDALFSIFIISLAAWAFEVILSKTVRKPMNGKIGQWKNIVLSTLLAVILSAVFLSFDLQSYILIDNTIHQTVAAVGLAAGTIYFGVKAWLLWILRR